jgi:hypothetical protein
MEQVKFNDQIQKTYLSMHDLIVQSKLSFLRIIQFNTVDDNIKDNLRNELLIIAKHLGAHFDTIRYAKINEYNIAEYEKVENRFLKETKREIIRFIRDCKRMAPVKLKKDIISSEDKIDQEIMTSKIYGTRALEIDTLKKLQGFYEYIIGVSISEEQSKPTDQVHQDKNGAETRSDIDRDLLDLKAKTFCEKLTGRHAVNPEIFYKIKTKIESVIIHDNRLNVLKQDNESTIDTFNENELYIVYDDLYNFNYLYKTGNIQMSLEINLIKSTTKEHMVFNDSIVAETEVSVNKAKARIPFKPGIEKTTIESFNTDVAAIIEDLELSKIYYRTLEIVKKRKDQIETAEKAQQDEMNKKISDSLDEIL